MRAVSADARGGPEAFRHDEFHAPGTGRGEHVSEAYATGSDRLEADGGDADR